MSGHVHDHCKVPRTWLRRDGSLWCCTCGRIYVLRWFSGGCDSFRSWELWSPPTEDERTTLRP